MTHILQLQDQKANQYTLYESCGTKKTERHHPKLPPGTYRQAHAFSATGCTGGGMIIDQFWRPDRQTRSAIRRGDKLARAYFERKKAEYDLAMIARLTARRNAKRLDKEDASYEVV